jgi:hypothetical protein
MVGDAAIIDLTGRLMLREGRVAADGQEPDPARSERFVLNLADVPHGQAGLGEVVHAHDGAEAGAT